MTRLAAKNALASPHLCPDLVIFPLPPPVGTSLFICAKTANIRIEEMYKAIIPFLIPLLIVLFLITYVPGFVTWFPGLSG